jgi:hypothetical protein
VNNFTALINLGPYDTSEHHEKLIRTTVHLEEESIEAIEELIDEFSKETGRKWSMSAVIRLALSDFFSRKGKSCNSLRY